jgi:hypothetical protein
MITASEFDNGRSWQGSGCDVQTELILNQIILIKEIKEDESRASLHGCSGVCKGLCARPPKSCMI